MPCRDVTHDIMVSPDDVTSENKRHTLDTACPKHMNTELPKNSCQTQGRDHPDHWVVRPMPHIYCLVALVAAFECKVIVNVVAGKMFYCILFTENK